MSALPGCRRSKFWPKGIAIVARFFRLNGDCDSGTLTDAGWTLGRSKIAAKMADARSKSPPMINKACKGDVARARTI